MLDYLKNILKLIKRSNRAQFITIVSIIAPILLFLMRNKYEEFPLESMPFTFTAILISVINAFTFLYGIHTFSWESRYYTFFASQPINVYKYIQSKYWLNVFSILIWSFISICIVFGVGYPVEVPLLLFSLSIYCCGMNVPLILLISTYNRDKIDLDKAIIIYDKIYPLHLLILLICVIFPVILFINIYQIWNLNIAFITLISIGFVGMLFQNILIKYISQSYVKNHYNFYKAFSK